MSAVIVLLVALGAVAGAALQRLWERRRQRQRDRYLHDRFASRISAMAGRPVEIALDGQIIARAVLADYEASRVAMFGTATPPVAR